MKVFKHLVALADISVGFLGLFFIIFAITRPTFSPALAEKQRLEKTLEQLRADIRQLEQIKLAKSSAARQNTSADAAKITVALHELTVELRGRQSRFPNPAAFARSASKFNWPENVVLLIDHRVSFDKVVAVIDALKQINKNITVQIAALAGGK